VTLWDLAPHAIIVNENIFADNQGIGIDAETVTGNLTCSRNCFWNNSGSQHRGVTNKVSNWSQSGNFLANPNFSRPNDYHLSKDSPCIDAGSWRSVPAELDIDGEARLQQASVDVGADETQWGAPYVFTTFAGSPWNAGSQDGVGVAARFHGAGSIALDGNGNLFVCETGDRTIRRVTDSGEVTTIAGAVGVAGYVDGAGATARFELPRGIAADLSGALFVADLTRIRKISQNGMVSTFVEDWWPVGHGYASAVGVVVDRSGTVYVTENQVVTRISSSGSANALAGRWGVYGSIDGVGDAARFGTTGVGIACDAECNLYVADSLNRTVRKISPDGAVITLAGKADGVAGGSDGAGSQARFDRPLGIAIDGEGSLFVTDQDGATIRKVAKNGQVTTIAGKYHSFVHADDVGSRAGFVSPLGIAVNRHGVVFVSDAGHTIRRGSVGTSSYPLP
jgi:sugar lactone lactonase YvrE